MLNWLKEEHGELWINIMIIITTILMIVAIICCIEALLFGTSSNNSCECLKLKSIERIDINE